MTAVVAKLDSKGRVSLPLEVRALIGNIVEIETVGEHSVLLRRANFPSRRPVNEIQEILKLFHSEPKRTGIPENPSPKNMKNIWKN